MVPPTIKKHLLTSVNVIRYPSLTGLHRGQPNLDKSPQVSLEACLLGGSRSGRLTINTIITSASSKLSGNYDHYCTPGLKYWHWVCIIYSSVQLHPILGVMLWCLLPCCTKRNKESSPSLNSNLPSACLFCPSQSGPLALKSALSDPLV